MQCLVESSNKPAIVSHIHPQDYFATTPVEFCLWCYRSSIGEEPTLQAYPYVIGTGAHTDSGHLLARVSHGWYSLNKLDENGFSGVISAVVEVIRF
jgi:hypothetical protein